MSFKKFFRVTSSVTDREYNKFGNESEKNAPRRTREKVLLHRKMSLHNQRREKGNTFYQGMVSL